MEVFTTIGIAVVCGFVALLAYVFYQFFIRAGLLAANATMFLIRSSSDTLHNLKRLSPKYIWAVITTWIELCVELFGRSFGEDCGLKLSNGSGMWKGFGNWVVFDVNDKIVAQGRVYKRLSNG